MQICNFLSEFTTFFTQKIIRKKKWGRFFGGAHIFLNSVYDRVIEKKCIKTTDNEITFLMVCYL